MVEPITSVTFSICHPPFRLKGEAIGLKLRRIQFVFLLSGLLFTSALNCMAQKAAASKAPARKIVSRVVPTYPPVAQRLHLQGVVKVEAKVTASGKVRSTRVLGGNPVLAVSAVNAVNQWKYEPAPAESTELIELTFDRMAGQ